MALVYQLGGDSRSVVSATYYHTALVFGMHLCNIFLKIVVSVHCCCFCIQLSKSGVGK